MSLLRTLVYDIHLKNNFVMVKTTGVRGPTLAQFDSVLVLLFEGRTSCSTSYYSPLGILLLYSYGNER